MNIAGRIKSIRESKGLTLEQLGKHIGKTKATVQRYESGDIKNLKNEVIVDIADALNVSPMVLMGWEPLDVVDIIKVPMPGNITCGDPIYAEENILKYYNVPSEDLPSGDLFFLQTQGDSMSPTIPEGSRVLIREQPMLENGEIGAFLMNDDTEATLKRYRVSDDSI